MKMVLLLFAVVLGMVAASPIKSGYQVGDRATDFQLKNVDGKMVSLANYKEAKGFIVIFDCNTCPYSKAYNSRMIGLNTKYSSLGFPVIAINANDPEQSQGDSFEEMVIEAKAKKYDFPYLVDENGTIAKMYGATNTPHVFVLQKTEAGLKVAYIGTIDDNARNESKVSKHYVQDAVNALLEGKEVTVSKTKAIGCGIKFKNS